MIQQDETRDCAPSHAAQRQQRLSVGTLRDARAPPWPSSSRIWPRWCCVDVVCGGRGGVSVRVEARLAMPRLIGTALKVKRSVGREGLDGAKAGSTTSWLPIGTFGRLRKRVGLGPGSPAPLDDNRPR